MPYKKYQITLAAIISILAACSQPKKAEETAPVKPIPQITTTTPTLPDSVCVVAVGDIMMGTSYPTTATLPPDSGINSFKNVVNHLKAGDITFGNLEGTLLNDGEPAHYKLHLKSKAYLFRSPANYGKILKDAGFNLLSIANNHIGDFGYNGRASTMKSLDSAGIHYAGLQTCPTTEFEVKGIKYGFCAFAPNSNTVSIFEFKGAAQIISDLKQRCDIVIVSFHGGGEGPAFEHIPFKNESYFSEQRGDVYAFAHFAVDSGADLIFGNGPHVSRAMEVYKGRLIAYSLGNFFTYSSVNITGISGIAPLLKVYVNRKGEFLSGNIISTRQSHEKGLEPDTLNRAAKRVKMLTTADIKVSPLFISETGELSLVAKD